MEEEERMKGYSSGESMVWLTSNKTYSNMRNDIEKQDHITNLWKKCWLKAWGSQVVLNVFSEINERLVKYGTNKHLDYKIVNKIDYILSTKPEYVLLPEGTFLTYWNLIIVLLLMYVATYMPFRICFHKQALTLTSGDKVDLFVDSLFVVDIIINFFSAYYDTKTLLPVVKYKAIARNYVTGYFSVDLVSAIPF